MLEEKEKILFRPWGELKRLQNRKLHHFITRHLYPFSSYYRQLFDKNKINPDKIKTVEDLQNIPFTTKKDFFYSQDINSKSRGAEFILQPSEELIKKQLPKKEFIKYALVSLLRGKKYLKTSLEKEYTPIFLTSTTGTTGQPLAFLYTNHDIKNLKMYGRRIVEVFGVNRMEKAINVFPYAPHLAFWQVVFAGLSSNMFILSTGGGKTLGTEGNIRSILKVKPQLLIGVPSYVYHILKTAREQNRDLSFLNKIALGASRVPKGFKRKVSKLLTEMGSSQVEIIGTYGFTESRCAWAECPTDINTSSGYHTYPDTEVFEVIDPETGEVKGEGEDGEIVYSNIDARGSCVLRYRTGDLVKGGIVYSPCPHCKRKVPRISSDIVRASNITNVQFSKIKGTIVNLNTLTHLLENNEEIDEWHIEIVKKNNDPYEVDELILYLSLLSDIDKEEFKQILSKEVLASTEVSFNKINFVDRKEVLHKIEIESALKAKKIVDRRPKT